MPDLSYAELSELSHVITLLGPGISLALSQETNREIALERPEVDLVPIQEILQSADSVVQTAFTLSAPFSTDNVLLVPRELVGLLSGITVPGTEEEAPDEPPPPFSESDIQKLDEVLTAAARGLAQSLSDYTGSSVELESHSTTQGSVNLPPVFAMEGNAVRADFPLGDITNLGAKIFFLFTPDFARQLLPSTENSEAGADEIIGEDDLAAMLSGLTGSDETALPAVAPSTGASNRTEPQPGGLDSMPRGLDLILDIPLEVTVELGRVRMLIKDVIELSSGSIIELDRVAGEPVDLFVNGRLVAKGEVVVIEDNFGLRITEIVSPADRVAGLGKGR
jgi:flagellar motor switch protein FliN/FliY